MSALLLEASDAHQVHCPTLAANPSRLLTVLRPVASGFPPDDDELEFEQDDGEPQQDDDEPAAEQDPSVRSTPPLVFEPPRPYGAAFYECDVNVTTCADMHLHHWKTAPRGERITHLKLWGHGLQPKDVDPAQVLQVYFYAFWSDNSYTVEPRSTLLKCYRAKKLAEIQAKTCNAARTAVVGARAGVAGFVVGGCCCGGSGSADRCSGSCLLAGTSDWSLFVEGDELLLFFSSCAAGYLRRDAGCHRSGRQAPAVPRHGRVVRSVRVVQRVPCLAPAPPQGSSGHPPSQPRPLLRPH
jgi:hypothetical protein